MIRNWLKSIKQAAQNRDVPYHRPRRLREIRRAEQEEMNSEAEPLAGGPGVEEPVPGTPLKNTSPTVLYGDSKRDRSREVGFREHYAGRERKKQVG